MRRASQESNTAAVGCVPHRNPPVTLICHEEKSIVRSQRKPGRAVELSRSVTQRPNNRALPCSAYLRFKVMRCCYTAINSHTHGTVQKHNLLGATDNQRVPRREASEQASPLRTPSGTSPTLARARPL